MGRYQVLLEGDTRSAFFRVEGAAWKWIYVFDGQLPEPWSGSTLTLALGGPSPFVWPTCSEPLPTEADAILAAVAWMRTQGVVRRICVAAPEVGAPRVEASRRRTSGTR